MADPEAKPPAAAGAPAEEMCVGSASRAVSRGAEESRGGAGPGRGGAGPGGGGADSEGREGEEAGGG